MVRQAMPATVADWSRRCAEGPGSFETSGRLSEQDGDVTGYCLRLAG